MSYKEPITCGACGRRMIVEFCCTKGKPFCHMHCPHEKDIEGNCCELIIPAKKVKVNT